MDTLHWCFQLDTEQGLNAKTIPIATELLSHAHCSIRGRAARLLYNLTVPLEGKEEGTESGCVPLLVGLLHDRDAFVRAQAAAALMRYILLSVARFVRAQAAAALMRYILLSVAIGWSEHRLQQLS